MSKHDWLLFLLCCFLCWLLLLLLLFLVLKGVVINEGLVFQTQSYKNLTRGEVRVPDTIGVVNEWPVFLTH